MLGLNRFIEKLRHRSVWQVLGVYVVGSWVAIQVVDILGNNFALPAWFPRFTLALLVIGLPVVLVTSLVQKRLARWAASDDSPDGHTTPFSGVRLFTWRNAIRGGLVAFAVWAVVAASWVSFGPSTELLPRVAVATGDLRSIAVLPLVSLRSDEESLAFTSGIHDDLLTQLSKIDSLTTISRTSVMKYRDTQLGVRQIAAELGVATLLEGSVQLAGERVRVSVQLIDARNDRTLWAETYDAEFTTANIFAIQSDIARQIAAALSATLTPEVEVRLATRPTESLQAYDLYTRGRYLHQKPGAGTQSALEEAAQLFRQAIEVDPAFAPAYAGLADIYLDLWSSGYVPAEQALPEARAAAEQALELDETLAAAHTSLADLFESELRFADAERQHLRALELNPSSAEAQRTGATPACCSISVASTNWWPSCAARWSSTRCRSATGCR
jgi:TolB-like protein